MLPDFSEITKGKPEKKLVVGLKKSGGRNNTGRITVRHRGGGHKKLYRTIDFHGYPERYGRVLSIEYDPNRTARIALVQFEDGKKEYIIAPVGLQRGDSVLCGSRAEFRAGHRLPLQAIPEGTVISNIELVPGRGGQVARAAGAAATLMVRGDKFAQVKLPSGEIRLFPVQCLATIGQVSNPEHKYESSGKAVRTRWMGIRPTVRGVAMNPVDHPMGGGEGKGKGHQSQSPWAQPSKGYKTRRRAKPSDRLILQRRKQ